MGSTKESISFTFLYVLACLLPCTARESAHPPTVKAQSNQQQYQATEANGEIQTTQFVARKGKRTLHSPKRHAVSEKQLERLILPQDEGMYSVRGYDEYEIVADGGILASIQYEYGLVRHTELPHQSEPAPKAVQTNAINTNNIFIGELTPLILVDFSWNRCRSRGEGTSDVLVGRLGTAVELGNNFSGAVYYGYPTKATGETRGGKG